MVLEFGMQKMAQMCHEPDVEESTTKTEYQDKDDLLYFNTMHCSNIKIYVYWYTTSGKKAGGKTLVLNKIVVLYCKDT